MFHCQSIKPFSPYKSSLKHNTKLPKYLQKYMCCYSKCCQARNNHKWKGEGRSLQICKVNYSIKTYKPPGK